MWKQVRNLDLSAVQSESGAIAADTLLLWGNGDTFVAPSQAGTLERLIPRSTLRIIPGAGHNAHEDDPGAVGAELTAFFAYQSR
jgi:pimeloyl-ACP methyl ester carboxylesterase